MKRDKILYWTTTGLISLAFLMSSFMYLSKNEELMKGFNQMGFPAFFVTILGAAKLMGALALLSPKTPKLREWAYAGFTFTLIGAAWVHVATHTPFIMPLVFLALLGLSYYFNSRVNKASMQMA